MFRNTVAAACVLAAIMPAAARVRGDATKTIALCKTEGVSWHRDADVWQWFCMQNHSYSFCPDCALGESTCERLPSEALYAPQCWWPLVQPLTQEMLKDTIYPNPNAISWAKRWWQ